MFTDQPGAGVQRVGQERHVRREVGRGQLVDGPGPVDHRVVVDGQRAVGGQPDVELDPVGAQAAGPAEGRRGCSPGSRWPDRGCPGGPGRRSVATLADLLRTPDATSGDIRVKSHVEGPRKCLQRWGPVDYSSERTLNGR